MPPPDSTQISDQQWNNNTWTTSCWSDLDNTEFHIENAFSTDEIQLNQKETERLLDHLVRHLHASGKLDGNPKNKLTVAEAKALSDVVDHFLADEEKHWNEDDQPKIHIYHDLMILANALGRFKL